MSALALAGCKSNDDNSEWAGNEGVVFNSRIEGLTRASGSAWSANDAVGIFMSETGKGIASATDKNKKYLAQADGTLNAATGNAIYFPAEGNVDFIAYYPYSESLNGTTYEVNVADQTKPEAIDLLYSNNATNIAKSATVGLTFEHRLSQIVLNLSNDGTLASLKGLKVTLSGTNTTAAFDLGTGTLAANDSKADIALNVNADATKATAIVLPASAAELNGTKLTFTLDGTKPFEAALPAETVYEAGTQYTYNVKLSLNNGKIIVNMGKAEITDWTEKPGGDINVDFEEGESKPSEDVTLLDETFKSGQGNSFTIEDVTVPEGKYVWKAASYTDKTTNTTEYYMKASGYMGANTATESRLVSKELNLTGATKAILTFRHAFKFFTTDTHTTDLTLQVKEKGGEWTNLNIPNYSEGKDYTFVESGEIDLSAYANKIIQIAFRYTSSTENAMTWEVNDIKVVADGGTATPDPSPDPQPEPTPSGNELYISEYVEGSNYNKYIEVYNPTDAAVDLSAYRLVMKNYSSKDTYVEDQTVTLSGTLASKTVIVYKNSKATAYTGEAQSSEEIDKVLNFNGNDPVLLYKGENLIDYVGVEGKEWGKDLTLTRKSTVSGPSATYDEGQWDKANKDDVSSLGKR